MTPGRRSQILRSNRWVLDGSLGGRVQASFTHAGAELEAGVLDVSIHGARLALAATGGHFPTILLSDRLDPLTIRFEREPLYIGAATVRQISERPECLELGVALEQTALDLGQMHRLATRRLVSQRWKQALGSSDASVDPEFRAWVSQLASFLETAKSFLDREEAGIASWDLHTREMICDELLEAVSTDLVGRMDVASRELGTFVSGLSKEESGYYRVFLEHQVGRYFNCSPFLDRAKRKPLGYAGDYEMMNMLCRDRREGATLFGKAMNLYVTQQASARANVNRIAYLSDTIKHAIANSSSGRTRVAGVGCGPAKEVLRFLTENPELGERLEITLIDQEERAITYCERSLAPLAAATNARVHVIRESARRLLADRKLREALGECDLVYSPGLFDYLSPRSFSALLRVLYEVLRDSGWLVIGNVAADNPDRYVLEYLADRHLHHRSPDELLHLASELAPKPQRVLIDVEPSGVNLFLLAQR